MQSLQNRLKILIVGEDVPGGWARTFRQSFEDFGCESSIFDDRKTYFRISLLHRNRYISHFFWWFLAIPLQNKILDAVFRTKPDTILILKGWLIKPETIKKIKEALPDVIIFNYNPDNPFNNWAHGNSNSWVKNSIPLYDAYFIWGEFLRKPILSAGAKRFEYLPCGYDPKLHYKLEAKDINNREYYESDIAFIGTYDKEREYWLGRLLDFNLKIWGNSWEKANTKIQQKWQRKEMVGEDFSRVCNSAKIILNFVRKQNGSSHNMRTFEVPACGGFMLSTRTEEQSEFFEEGKEMDFFSSPEELREKIKFYLSNEEKRLDIANAGYRKVLSMKATYSDRARRILEVYKEIVSQK